MGKVKFHVMCLAAMLVMLAPPPASSATPRQSSPTGRALGVKTVPRPVVQEVVRDFRSRVQVRPDGSLLVREEIVVLAAGVNVKRGIIRDLPLRPQGKPYRSPTPYKIVSASIDGQPLIGYRMEKSHYMLGVRMGDENKPLENGEHTFILEYETSGHVRRFSEHDELTWNVTGNAWDFVIENASCEIILPQGASVGKTVAWVGKRGSRDQSVDIHISGSSMARFVAQNPLPVGNGFTVAVAFPQGVVSAPEPSVATLQMLNPVVFLGALLFGPRDVPLCVICIAYFLAAWVLWGRDPKPGTIVPLYYPPPKDRWPHKDPYASGNLMSPAAVDFVRQTNTLTDNALASLFVSLALHGGCAITRVVGKSYSVRVLELGQESVKQLNRDEQLLYGILVTDVGIGKTLPMNSNGYTTMAKIRIAVDLTLRREYSSSWNRNLCALYGGWVLAIGCLLLTYASPLYHLDLFALGGAGKYLAAVAMAIAAALIIVLRDRNAHPVKTALALVRGGNRMNGMRGAVLLLAVAAGAYILLTTGVSLILRTGAAAKSVIFLLVIFFMLYCLVKAYAGTGLKLLIQTEGILLAAGIALVLWFGPAAKPAVLLLAVFLAFYCLMKTSAGTGRKRRDTIEGILLVAGVALALWLGPAAMPAVLLLAVPLVFHYLMKAPTGAGRDLLDRIEGFLMYMRVAEKDRLTLLNQPEDTPEVFERVLPYAMAVGLENTWCERFSTQLAQGLIVNKNLDVGSWDSRNVNSFSSSFRESTSSALSSGDSSGSSGGSSFSGGGGGVGSGGGGGGGRGF